jgi:hypothetical protein
MPQIDAALGLKGFGLACAKNTSRLWQGGNQWSGSVAHLSFFREKLGFEIDWTKWIHWENAAIHGGPRIMHEKFCIISDRPEILKVDNQNRPHAEGGPFCQWRDGSALYAYEGVRMPKKYGSVPVENWKPEWIDAEKNADVRAKLLKGIGFERWLQASGGTTLHEQEIGGLPYKLIAKRDPAIGEMKFLHMQNPSVPGVYHLEPVAPHDWIETCEDALNWRLGAESKATKHNVIFKA